MKTNFFLQSRNRIDGTNIIAAGFETANEALKAFDNLPSTMQFNGVRVCRSIPQTGSFSAWSEWLTHDVKGIKGL